MARGGAPAARTTMAQGQSRPHVSRTAGSSHQPFTFPALWETRPLALWYLTGHGGTAPRSTPCGAGYSKPRLQGLGTGGRGAHSLLKSHQTLGCITSCSRLLLYICASSHSACLWVTTSGSRAPATSFCNSKLNSRFLTRPKSQDAKEREPLCLRFSQSPAALPGLGEMPTAAWGMPQTNRLGTSNWNWSLGGD